MGQIDQRPDELLRAIVPPESEVIVYFGDDLLRMYQLRQWLPVFELLDVHHRVLVVTRDPDADALVRTITPLPCAYLPSFAQLSEMYRSGQHKIVIYVNNSMRNFQSLVARSALHIHVNHGESDKICMVSNQVKAYDRVFVAGEAAMDRHRAALIELDDARLVPVGRPQLDLRPAPILPPTSRRTILYAPTWEGEEPWNNYTSVDVMGPSIVAAALAVPDSRVVYKPHPRILDSEDRGMIAGHHEILGLIAGANAVDPDAGHETLLSADILAVIPDSDLMVTDVSSVGLDFLYLRGNRPLFITDRYSDYERLRTNAPVSRCTDVLHPESLAGLSTLLASRLVDDVHLDSRQEMRRHYFGDATHGASTRRFLAAVDDAIATRDRLVAARAALTGPDGEAATLQFAPVMQGWPA